MKKRILIACVLLVAAVTTNAQQKDFPRLAGPYLGQKPPGMTPEIFAPGIVSSEHQEHSSLAFSPDGNYLFFTKYTEGSHEDFYWVDAKVIKELRPIAEDAPARKPNDKQLP